MAKQPVNYAEEQQALLSFLTRTREGMYAEIESTSFPYSRILEQRETVEPLDEEFYYSVS